MFTGEAELKTRRRILTTLQDESRIVLEGARNLRQLYDSVLSKNSKEVEEIMSKIRISEEEVEDLRRGLARQLAEVGSLMDNREDVLRVAYNLESLTSYLVGMSFRISHLNSGTVTKAKLEEPLRQLVEYVLEMVHRLNEVVRSLAINPDSAWELAGSVQSVEREIDDLYRNLTIEVLKKVKDIPDLLLIKDIIEKVENMADSCQNASDAVTVLALGF